MVHFRRGLLTFGVLASAAPAVITPGDVFSCLTSYNVPFYTNQSSNWTSLVTPFNLRLIFEPDVITIPLATVDVSNSVICASRAGLKVQAKGGGHSYASYSNGGLDGSMIVNLQGLQSVNVDNGKHLPSKSNAPHIFGDLVSNLFADTGIATVGGGARLGNMATAIYNQGQRALPHGTCPTVGIGGHFTHGGYGYASRLWGLALDSIVGLDIVLANGSFVHTSETQNADIYYALRGAADSFGIVTNFYLQTLPAPRFVLYFDVEIPLAIQNVSTITNGFLQLQETVNDPEIVNGNLSFGITTDEKGTFEIKGWCIECNETIFGTTTLPALLKGFPTPESITIQPLGWLASLGVLAGGPLLVPATGPVGTGQNDTFYAKSLVTKTAQPLAAEEWNAFWSFVIDQGQGAKAPSPWFSIINLYGGAGSQINVPLSNSSAYPDRDALWVFQVSLHSCIFLLVLTDDITELRQYNQRPTALHRRYHSLYR